MLPVVVKKTKSPFYLYLISFEVKAEVGVKSILDEIGGSRKK
jgi:hypothetical protein